MLQDYHCLKLLSFPQRESTKNRRIIPDSLA